MRKIPELHLWLRQIMALLYRVSLPVSSVKTCRDLCRFDYGLREVQVIDDVGYVRVPGISL